MGYGTGRYYPPNASLNPVLLRGDCVSLIGEMPSESVDAVVTDPPYGIVFMGREWDKLSPADVGEKAKDYAKSMEEWHVAWLSECYRVLKPGGQILAFSATRTYHRLASAMEIAGFELVDTIHWTYGSGFPKSLDLSKAIDKRRYDDAEILEVTAWIREVREKAGMSNRELDDLLGYKGMASHWTSRKSQPAVPTLEQVPELLWALRVDNSEIPERIQSLLIDLNGKKGQPGEAWFRREVTGTHEQPPAGATWRVNNGQRADTETKRERRDKPSTPQAEAWQGWGTALKPSHEPIVVGVKGGEHFTYPRIIYCPKPTRAERNEGMDSLPKREWITGAAVPMRQKRPNQPNANFHPTVKPIALMRNLVAIASPLDGVVLDPFLGSGTTAVASILEGRKWLGCELTEDYWEIIEARTQWAEMKQMITEKEVPLATQGRLFDEY